MRDGRDARPPSHTTNNLGPGIRVWAEKAESPWVISYPAKLRANSTRLLRAMPEGPLAIQGLASSVHAVPAMSRWIQGVSSANSLRNMAAVMEPPQRPPEFTISAIVDLMLSLYSSSSGRRHIFSPAWSSAVLKRSYILSSLAKTPAFT